MIPRLGASGPLWGCIDRWAELRAMFRRAAVDLSIIHRTEFCRLAEEPVQRTKVEDFADMKIFKHLSKGPIDALEATGADHVC